MLYNQMFLESETIWNNQEAMDPVEREYEQHEYVWGYGVALE